MINENTTSSQFDAEHAVRVLWAKKSRYTDAGLWLSLTSHMTDVAEMARLLWKEWLPDGVKQCISRGVLLDETVEYTDPEALLVFLAYVHDIGKASPCFQARHNGMKTDEVLRKAIVDSGLIMELKYQAVEETRHATVSHAILRNYGFSESVSVVAGGHHGVYPSYQVLKALNGRPNDSGFGKKEWLSVQSVLVERALELAELTGDVKSLTLTRPAQVLLTSVIVIADWLASDESLCPLVSLATFEVNSKARVRKALDTVGLLGRWQLQSAFEGLYSKRFGFSDTNVRPAQKVLLDVVQRIETPGIVIFEAPMGCGKTEAALGAAEVLAERTGRRGVYFALPTQATSNAMFTRLLNWLNTFESGEEKLGVRLLHGKADFNDEYTSLKVSKVEDVDPEKRSSVAVAQEWLNGSRRGILADFTVGTIDQVLLAGLRSKYVVLRHLGFANKVVIIDECHAYDVYMKSYLLNTIKWLGAYGVPVIVLSATLSVACRQELVQAYLNIGPKKLAILKEQGWLNSKAYPLITYTDGTDVQLVEVNAPTVSATVSIERIADDAVVSKLEQVLANGGCAGVIVNTVKRAQKLHSLLSARFGASTVKLLHSQFIASDRAKSELNLLSELGPPTNSSRPIRCIVVGTQVFEQSLDVDFDVLITDLCPMDLLIQRIGRLHRHNREHRPDGLKQPVCYVLGADLDKLNTSSKIVYGKYLLMRTCAVLPSKITLPSDIPELVSLVYDEGIVSQLPIPSKNMIDFEKARKDWLSSVQERKRRADTFQLAGPTVSSTMVGWHIHPANSESEKSGEATVRDGADSVEVVVLQKRNGNLCLLPWVSDGRKVGSITPDTELAKLIAGCSVRLPAYLGRYGLADKVIAELEKGMNTAGITDSWQMSPWLRGELCIILNENLEAHICGYTITYDQHIGLKCEED